jgi:hypothetical protein
VKIGFSKDPVRRVRQLQTGQPVDLVVHYSEPVTTKKARFVEKAVHRTLAPKALRGEWFAISVEDAILEVKYGIMRWDEALLIER